jgi:ABC-type Mn2+/Zn2+ transport system permease subunit
MTVLLLAAGGFSEVSFVELVRFFLPMLLTCGALAAACAVLGVFVLLRREALVALSLPNAVVIGAAIAMLAHSESRLPYATGGLALALPLLAWTRYRRFDHLLPAAYVAGMCIPFLIIASHGGEHLGELEKMFIGAGVDVAVSPDDARVAIPILLGAAAVAAVLWRRWLLLAQAPTTAQLAALHPAAWDGLFLTLTGAAVLMGTNTMGVVMVLVLLFLPAAAALPWGRRLPGTMALAVVFGLVDAAIGFYLSNRLDWPFSQSVGGVGFVVLVLSHLLGRFAR